MRAETPRRMGGRKKGSEVRRREGGRGRKKEGKKGGRWRKRGERKERERKI